MFNQLLDIHQRNDPHPSFYCNYFMTYLLMKISMGRPTPRNRSGIDNDDNTLQQVEDWISINSIAENFDYSPSYLSTIYKWQFGMGTTERIRQISIEDAQELLVEISSSVSQNAEASRYNDPKSFMWFLERFSGLVPTRHRFNLSVRHYNNACSI